MRTPTPPAGDNTANNGGKGDTKDRFDPSQLAECSWTNDWHYDSTYTLRDETEAGGSAYDAGSELTDLERAQIYLAMVQTGALEGEGSVRRRLGT